MNLFKNTYFYVIVCDNKTVDTVYGLTLAVIDFCRELAKQGHHVVLKKVRIRG